MKELVGAHCMLLFGSTGVGKSTLANALIQGVDSMKEIDDEDDQNYENLVCPNLRNMQSGPKSCSESIPSTRFGPSPV